MTSSKEISDEIERIMNGEIDADDQVENDFEDGFIIFIISDTLNNAVKVTHRNHSVGISEDEVKDGYRVQDTEMNEENDAAANDEEEVEDVAMNDEENAVYNDVEVEEEDDDNIPLARIAQIQSKVIVLQANSLKGRNKHRWSTKQPTRSRRTAARNIIHFFAGSANNARELLDPTQCFLHFFSDQIIQEIVTHTNQHTSDNSAKYAKQTSTISQTSKEEIRALLGLLIFSAL
ncbi:Transposase IS4 [Popillia japonica]|uniref:Transposase IS4 n=1 Tax=Popillia japonica TaxID=7064 RepID=A0AAW1MDJ8_POPJA